jgi:3-dehydroquinate synthase
VSGGGGNGNIETLRVGLGVRGYDILVGEGLIADAGSRVRARAGDASRRIVVVTDENVARHHLEPLCRSFERAGFVAERIVLPPGEQTKDVAHYAALTDDALGFGVDRRSLLVALGGGVIGDLVGFAAATLLRGIDFVQVPTTLLAQVDSSVGGKTGINTRHGKNLLGAFHQPILVLADTAALATLPRREVLAGYAEVAKYGFIRDPEFFEWLERDGAALCAGDARLRRTAVLRSCAHKAAVVAADEREQGERALLNFGHTFGHAIETATGYGAWLHGEAIAAGMVMAAELSARLGLLSSAEVVRLRDLVARAGLPVKGPAAPAEKMLEIMALDKKGSRGQVRFVLLDSIGMASLRAGVDVRLAREAIVAAAQ